MGPTENVTQTGVFFTCIEKNKLVTEQLIPEHLLMHVYTGKITVTTADKTYVLLAGQTALFSKNQLAKFTKESDEISAFKAATIFFTKPYLQQFYEDVAPLYQKSVGCNALYIKPHVLLTNLFESVYFYSNLEDALVSQELSLLKVKEALTVIRTLHKDVDLLLSNFSEPHKIDLIDFMEKNFMFNISIPRFAYLTGRSLATFKRDFHKTFGAPPQKWLTAKRLQQAHFLITEKKQKPSQVYIEVGFENFSHFTFNFRKFFGYTPSSLLSSQAHTL